MKLLNRKFLKKLTEHVINFCVIGSILSVLLEIVVSTIEENCFVVEPKLYYNIFDK